MFKVLEQPSEFHLQSTASVLAQFLEDGCPKRAAEALSLAGGLSRLMKPPSGEVVKFGLSPKEARLLRAAREIAGRFLGEKLYETQITSAAAAEEFLSLKMSHLSREVFSVIWLNQKHHIISYEEMFIGTINAAAVYPRCVAKRALELGACAVILAHNHPSGDPAPSPSDVDITRKLQEVLEIFEVRVLDHIVVGKTTVSFAQEGLL